MTDLAAGLSPLRVVGETALSHRIRKHFQAQLSTNDLSGYRTILCGWPSLELFIDSCQNSSGPILVIEGGLNSELFVGPSFQAGAPCIHCYIDRRRANNAQEIRPQSAEASARQWESLVGLLDGWFLDTRSLSGRQVEVQFSGELSSHTLLSAPGCGCMDGASCVSASPIVDLVSGRLGLINRLSVESCLSEQFFCAHALGCRSDALGGQRALNQGFAVGPRPDEAALRAAMESVERYCAAFYPNDLCFESENEFGPRHWGMDRFPGYGHCPSGVPLSWVSAHCLHSGQTVSVPASLVYLPYKYRPREWRLPFQSSSGLAAHNSVNEAVRRGVFEVLERDAFLQSWDNHLPVERISARSLSVDGLHLARIPYPTVPVVVALIESGTAPYTACGLAARLDVDQAVSAAIVEAVASRESLVRQLATGALPPKLPPQTLRDHALAHALYPELACARRHWLIPELPSRGRESNITWEGILEAIPEVCFVEITTPDVACLGLHVVRVLIPGCQPFGGCRQVNTPHPLG